MQYIQLQGQDAQGLDTPINGAYNLFVDTTDNTIKIKDENGNLIGGGAGIVDITFSELNDLWDGLDLTPGQYYKITDYQTCYDQPNFDANQNAITTGNYKSGSVEELVVFATSASTLSPNAYSLNYPKDTIKYDINFTQTEVTNGLAKGRIYERIDEVGNRTDYDWRAVQFKRYRQYYAQNTFNGKVTIGTTDTTGSIIGVGTQFDNNFSVGDVIGVYNTGTGRIGGFDFYEIVDVSGSSYMGITGSYYNTISDTYYSYGSGYNGYSAFQTNTVSVGKEEAEYYTFNAGEGVPSETGWYNNYLGDNNEWDMFRLSNNVFRGGAYKDNYFGSNCEGNTFNDDMFGNKCGRNFQYNVIEDDFDNNQIGDSFRYNFMSCDFQENTIANNFEYNMIADDDGIDFNFNIINGDSFSHNWTIGYDHFHSNIISDDFDNNVMWGRFGNNLVNGSVNNNFFDGNVDYNQFKQNFNNNNIYNSFQNNVVNSFYQNTMLNSFDKNHFSGQAYSNTFSGSFYQNSVGNEFYGNTFGDYDVRDNRIGNDFYDNQILCVFNNNTIGSEFFDNTIANVFRDNTIGNEFENNTIGDVEDIDGYNFEDNVFGNTHKGNLFLENFGSNTFKNFSTSNEFNGYTEGNTFGSYVFFNTIGNSCENNQIGNSFYDNLIGTDFENNQIGNSFNNNNISNFFAFNVIGERFNNNTIATDFGFGGDEARGNRIGNYFQNNTIGEYFYENQITDLFENNIVGDYFQLNNVSAYNVDGVDFTTNYGNIIATSIATNATNVGNGSYVAVTGSTNSANGLGASFDILIVSGGFTYSINNSGNLYSINDGITILGTSIGGATPADDIVFNVTQISPTPVVYTQANSNIIRNYENDLKLTYIGTSFGIVSITESFD